MRCLGPMFRESGVSHSAVRNTTGGDTNPDRCWAFFRPVSGGLVAGRRPCRARSCLLRTAAVYTSGPVFVFGSLLQFRRSVSCPTTTEEYKTFPQKHEVFSRLAKRLST